MNVCEEILREINVVTGKEVMLDVSKPISEQTAFDSLDYINLIVNLEEKYNIELFPVIVENENKSLSELIELISKMLGNGEYDENVKTR